MTQRAVPAWVVALQLAALPLGGTAAAQSAPGADARAGPQAVVQACIDRVDGALTGLTELEKRCPDLPAALQAAGVRPLIIDSSRALFDRNSLRELFALMRPVQGPTPPVSALQPILRQLRGPAAPSRSWWQRMWDWVLERLAPRQQADASDRWLAGIVRLLSRAQWLWAALIWATVAALPFAVVVLVVREVRAMGKRSTDDPVAAAATAASGRLDSRLALLRQTPLEQRPAQLFAMLIARLEATGRLPPDRSLTHREVVRTALLDDADQLCLIESLARFAERQLYSGVATTPAGLEALLARAEDLYTIGWSRPRPAVGP